MQAKTKWNVARKASGVWVLGVGVFLESLAFAKAPACPPGQRPGISGCRSGAPQVRFTAPADATKQAGSNTPAADKEKGPKPAPRPDASLRPPNSLERADRRLLIQEIARLENLVKVTHTKSPDRAQLLLRLAGAYSELAKLAEHDYTRLEIQVDEMEKAKRATPSTNKQLAPETTGPSHHEVL